MKWRLLTSTVFLAACVGSGCASKDDSQESDDNEITSVAKTILSRWQKKDMLGVADFFRKPPSDRMLEDLKPGGPLAEAMTSDGDPFWRAVRDWKGDIREVRRRIDRNLVIAKKTSTSPTGLSETEFVLIQLVWEDGGWKFDGTRRIDVDDFDDDWGRQIKDTGSEGNTFKEFDPTSDTSVLHALAASFRDEDLSRVKKLSSRELLADFADGPAIVELKNESQPDDRNGEPSELSVVDQLEALAGAAYPLHADICKWNGRVLEMREEQEARVKFAESGDDVHLLVLEQEDGRWRLWGPLSTAKADYANWGTPLSD